MKFIKFGAVLAASILFLPILFVFFEMTFGDFTLLNHFTKHLLPRYIKDTSIVLFGVLILTTIFAVVSAYLVANFKFPLSKFFEFSLILPLAIPAYIFSFAYVGLLDYNGEFYKLFGFRFDIMNIYGAIFVLSLSLYPYIFLFAKTSFKTQSNLVFEVAQTYKMGKIKTFFKASLPLAKPAIFGGAMLVIMETLSDYGTAKYYGVETFSVGIFHVWYNLENSYLASFLASILLVFIFLIMYIEHKNKNFYSFGHNTQNIIKKQNLPIFYQILAFLWCFVLFTLAFLLPMFWLVYWSIFSDLKPNLDFVKMASNSFLVAIIASLLIVSVGLLLTFASRFLKSNFLKILVLKCSSVGYAVPGAIVGVCVMILFGYFDRNFDTKLLSSSFVVLIFGYMIRFMTAGVFALENGYKKISSNVDEAAKVLKLPTGKLFFGIHLPLLKHYIILAFTLAFIDIVKELPLSLILRPFNYETLSIRAFFYATDERLYSAALPSLLIVLLSLVAVICVEIFSRKNDA